MPTRSQFSKSIFMVWFQGVEAIERPAFKQNVANWALLNPTWKVTCLSDKDLARECAAFSDGALETYRAFTVMHQKIDFGRYITLYNRGGIYVDIDAYALRSLDSSPHVANVLDVAKTTGLDVLALSTVTFRYPEGYLTSRGKSYILNNGIMMSTARHPVLRLYIQSIIDKMRIKPTSDVHSTTGPNEMRRFFAPFVEQPGPTWRIMLFPSFVFEPCNASDACNVKEHTVSLHQFQLSWLPAWERGGTVFVTRNRPVILGLVMGILLTLLVRRLIPG